MSASPNGGAGAELEDSMNTIKPSWIVRLALAVYPPAFRRRYGEELAHTWRRLDDEARRRGLVARIAWRAAAIADLVTTAGAEWLDVVAVPAPARRRLRHDRPLTRESAPMTGLLFDFKAAARAVARRPGLAASVIVTLALGIGANSAIFSLIDAVLLHPLPVEHPEQLVAVYQAWGASESENPTSYPAYRTLAEEHRALRGLAAYHDMQLSVESAGQAMESQAGLVSGNYFAVLGMRPQTGRLLTPDDEGAPGANPVVVLGDELWGRLYARNPSAVGSTLRIGPTAFRVIGVAPRGFRGVDLAGSVELWIPVSMIAHVGAPGFFRMRTAGGVLQNASLPWLHLVGRLREGVSIERAKVELDRLYDTRVRTLPTYPQQLGNVRSPMTVAPAIAAAVSGDRDALVRFVRLLAAVVGLTLALACVNVANLLLARWTERAREVGLRLALGASRGRVMRQLLLESLLLALGGGVAALVVAVATIRLLSAFTLPGNVALSHIDLALGWRVLAFTGGVATLTALAFGLIPALRSSRADLMDGLRRQTGQTARGGSRAALLGVQVAMSLVLLTGAALFLRSVRAGLRTDLGFDPTPLAAASVQLEIHGYDPQRTNAFYESVLQRLTSEPGVERVAIAKHVPLGPANQLSWVVGPVSVDSASGALANGGAPTMAGLNGVTPGYFATLGVRLVAGRDFAVTDGAGSAKVAIVNEAAARRYWPGEDPIGKELRAMGLIPYRVIGVVRTTKYQAVQEHDAPFVFVPLAQDPFPRTLTIVARSRRPAVALAAIERAVRATDRAVPIDDARLVRRQVDTALMPQRFGATLLTVFALLGIVVSAAGIYGTVRYTAARRLPEIGVRIALGARPADIIFLVGKATAVAVSTGLVAGFVTSAAATRLLSSFLYGVSPFDPIAFAGAALLLAATAFGVALVPARRASRTDPVASMRA